VSYTCLGDSVNLAARLEALNKKFGTYLCISHTTYEGCNSLFQCRRLAKVTVPGKAEVLPVYEVLCPTDGSMGLSSDPEDDDLSLSGVQMNVLIHKGEVDVPPSPGSGGVYYVLPSQKRDDTLVYQWQRVDRTRVLDHAAAYHHAYDALVKGDLPAARRWLSKRVLDGTDKAWDALEAQLKRQPPGSVWDGAFYFTEK